MPFSPLNVKVGSSGPDSFPREKLREIAENSSNSNLASPLVKAGFQGTSGSLECECLGKISLRDCNDQESLVSELFETILSRSVCNSEALIPKWEEVFKDGLNIAQKFDDKRGLIHGDLHPDNILVYEGKPFVIDWDLSGDGPVLWDVLTLLTSPYTKIPTETKLQFLQNQFIGLQSSDARLLFSEFCSFKASQLLGFSDLEPSLAEIGKQYSQEALNYAR